VVLIIDSLLSFLDFIGSIACTHRYLFGCGLNFRGCLADFTSIAGPIAMPPLHGVGVWWSRHWGDESGNKQMVDAVGVMSDEVLTTEVLDGYEQHNLPLHVLVCDMEVSVWLSTHP
jgi:alpha-glucosidase (family GH31 glycosyl hydrolase)